MYRHIKPTFNLPDCSGKLPIYDSAATLGNTTNGAVPNITSNITGVVGYLFGGDGALGAVENYQGKRTTSNGSDWGYYRANFDASRCSSVYDGSATSITPAGVYMLWCIKF